MIGGSVLAHILSLPATTAISRLTILSRSPVPMAAAKTPSNTTTQIEVINTTDYLNYSPELLTKLKDANGVIWAQGISSSGLDATTYSEITKDYPVAFAKALSTVTSKPVTFVYVSGEGANDSQSRFSPMYRRVKREAEVALLSLPTQSAYSNLRIYNTRPGGVDPSKQPEVWDQVKAKRSMVFKAGTAMMIPVLNVVWKNLMSPTAELGKVLTELALSDGEPLEEGEGLLDGGRTVRNIALRKLGGLPT